MAGKLHEFLSHDHDRLEAVLSTIVRDDGSIDMESYLDFRAGLLRHIAIEEKILFPALRAAARETEVERQLHGDHALLAALLVPPPSKDEIDEIRAVLTLHNPLEEKEGGLYEAAEEVSGEALEALMREIEAIPTVRMARNVDSPVVRASIEQLRREAEEGRVRVIGNR